MSHKIDTHALSWLPLRHRAEASAAGLPDLILAAERAAQSVLTGDHRQRKSGAGERFWQFRDYDPSDRPQDIDWRQSGKGDRVFVRQNERQTAQTLLFWLQGDRGMNFRSASALPFKRADGIVLALALSLLATRRGELTGLFGGGKRPGRNGSTLQDFGNDLLGVPPDRLPRTAAVPAQCSLVLVGDFLSDPDDIAATLDTLSPRVQKRVMIQLLDPAEIDLPFSGRIVFEDPGTGATQHILNVESVRDAYKHRMQTHIESIQALCRRYGWRYVLHRTDGHIKNTLFETLHMIGHSSGGTP